MLVEITDSASLEVVSDLLHDAIFEHADIAHDEATGTFRVVLWRELTELAQTRKWLPLVSRVVSPWVRSELEFRHVSGAIVKMTDSMGPAEHCLEDIAYDQPKGTIRFRIMGPLKIVLTVGALRGTLRDIGEATWDGPDMRTLKFG